jgi:hypothetical protein
MTLNDNVRVFQYMYPQVLWVQGAAAAPAHVRAFAQGGFTAAIFVLLLTGVLIALIGRLKNVSDRPLLFGLYIQGLICLYFLTQTSLRGAFIESYGLKYACFALGMLWVTRKVVAAAIGNIRAELANRRTVSSL